VALGPLARGPCDGAPPGDGSRPRGSLLSRPPGQRRANHEPVRTRSGRCDL